jgi:chitinase
MTASLSREAPEIHPGEKVMKSRLAFSPAKFCFPLVAILLAVVTCVPAFATNPPKVLMGFFEEWSIYYANYDLSDLYNNGSAAKLSHLIYAFGNVQKPSSPSGLCYVADAWADYQTPYLRPVNGIPDTGNLHGNFSELKKLKSLYPNLKVLISLGGYNEANRQAFVTASGTASGRQALVASCINMFVNGNVGNDVNGNPVVAANVFDGFNIDWEFPTSADKQNYTLLLTEFRNQLNTLGQQTGKHYIMSFDGPAGSDNYSNIDLYAASCQVDFITIDGYNYAGSWEALTNHGSPMWDYQTNPWYGQGLYIDYTESAYIAAGVPESKYIMGLPLFAAGWGGVPNINHGKYQNSTAPSPVPNANGVGLCSKWDGSVPGCDPLLTPGLATYNTAENLLSHGFTRYYDSNRDAVYLYNASSQIWYTFDDSSTVSVKTGYINELGLGGAFVWALKGDDANGTMVKTLATGLGR